MAASPLGRNQGEDFTRGISNLATSASISLGFVSVTGITLSIESGGYCRVYVREQEAVDVPLVLGIVTQIKEKPHVIAIGPI
ncbi:hypothetical protein RJJ11_29745 [Rhizobium hidalgonense]|nr:hypothetical protein [Rhizobium hidalgonense]